MKVIAILLAACVALVAAGPNPYRHQDRAAAAEDLHEVETALKLNAKSQWAWQSRAEKADAKAAATTDDSAVKAQDVLNATVAELYYYQPGKVIYIYGKAPSSGSFNIDLIPWYYGAYATDVIALRLTIDVDQYHVTRNSYAYEQWLYEENDGYSGIQPRRFFQIVIVLQTYSYEISIDGYHFATYYHRVPYTKNMKVKIDENIHSDPIEYF